LIKQPRRSRRSSVVVPARGGSLPGEGFSLADAPKSFKRDQVEKVLIWILDHDRNLHSDLASNLEQTHTHGHYALQAREGLRDWRKKLWGIAGWVDGFPTVAVYATPEDWDRIEAFNEVSDNVADRLGMGAFAPYYSPDTVSFHILEPKPVMRGGPGSGHHGHKGRPGEVGGSLPSDGGWWQDNPQARGHEHWTPGENQMTAGYKEARVDPREIAKLPGARGEQKNIDQERVKELAKSIKEEGLKWAPLIMVEMDGTAHIWEGNHRIRAAIEAGLESIIVEVRYFGGSEERPGIWKPELVERGGPGSGHHGHAGRPGEVGGSLPSGATAVGGNISEIMKVPQTPLWEPINRALRAIEKVHGVYALPLLAVKRSRAKRRRGAYFTIIHRDGSMTPDKINVVLGDESETSAMSMTHEIAHFLDHVMFGRDRYFTSEDMVDGEATFTGSDDKLLAISPNPDEARAFQKWWEAVQNSETYTAMRRHKSGFYHETADGKIVHGRPEGEGWLSRKIWNVPSKLIRSWNQPTEFFARSYAQYIATRSGDAWMNNELDSQLEARRQGFAPTQWERDDFEPIADAFDDLFESLGLLR
jgi:hypothetical protein